jgi:hypothetical protein
LITGRRAGPKICEEVQIWANELDIGIIIRVLRMTQAMLCIGSNWFFHFIVMSIPEAILYPITFHRMFYLTNTPTLSGALKSETIKRRNQQNTINIYVTFWAWLAQFFTNILNLILLHILYGQYVFLHGLFATLHLTLNFIILPLFYIIAADEQLKTAIYAKQYKEVVRILLT